MANHAKPAVKTYKDVPIAVTTSPKVIHKTGSRIVFARVSRMTPGVQLNIHTPASNEGFPLDEGEGIDLTDYDFREEVAYSVDAAPPGATVTFVIVEES